MTIRKYCYQGVEIPRWYGVAWRDYLCNQVVCYPVGLNWLAAVVRWTWYAVKFPPLPMRRTALEQALYEAERGNEDAHTEGFRQGVESEHAAHVRQEQLAREHGYNLGYLDGYRVAKEEGSR